MALMFPQPQQAMTPEGISRQRQIANALMQQGMDYSPVQSPWQGAARIAAALMGGYKGQQAEQAAMTLQREKELKEATEKAKAEQKAREEAKLPQFEYKDGAWFDVNPRTQKSPLQLSQAIQKREDLKKLNDGMLYRDDGKGGVEWITPPGASANAGNPYADEYQKQYAKDSAKKNAEISRKITTAGMDAQSQMSNLERMEQLTNDPDVYQGPLAESSLWARRLASNIPGLNQLPYSSPDAVGKSDELSALSNTMALMVRNPDAGLGMPGALSDKDREFLVSTVPGLSRSPAGNKLMIEAAKRIQKRKIEIAEFKAQYEQENGQIDDRFFEIVSKWAQENSLFDDIGNLPNMPKLAPAVGTVKDGYRFLGGDPSRPESWEPAQ